MAQLTQEMMDFIKSSKAFALATATRTGEPNVVPVGAVFLMDAETIWIGNQFMKTTIANLKENPRAALTVWTPGVKGCYKLKGNISILDSGEDYEKMKGMVSAKRADLFCKSLLVFRITEVYQCASGPDAGKRLL
ncbi:MAG: pyridoxamine 5'-phosphate oxidase family protein [Methanomassiliicoccales archaeon]